uniref:DUF4806 domain-containing protein n=1 Tax=Macrostomum lignano TaxID=282301 RepID=A0A1I8JAJ6_9PLAT
MKYIIYLLSNKQVIEACEEQCIMGDYASWTVEQWAQLPSSAEVHIQVAHCERLEDAVVLQIVPHECDTADCIKMLRTVIREKKYRHRELLMHVLPNRVRTAGRQSLPPLGNLWTADEATEDESDTRPRRHETDADKSLQVSSPAAAPSQDVQLPVLPFSLRACDTTTVAKSSASTVQNQRALSNQRQIADSTPETPHCQLQAVGTAPATTQNGVDDAINYSAILTTPHGDGPRPPPVGAFSAMPQLEAFVKRQVESRGYSWGSLEGLYCLQLLNLRETLKIRDALQRGTNAVLSTPAANLLPVNLPIRTIQDLEQFKSCIGANEDLKKALIQTRCVTAKVQQSVRYAMDELIARDLQVRFNRTGGKDSRRADKENVKLSFDQYFGEIFKGALSSKFSLDSINKAIQSFFDGVRKRKRSGPTVVESASVGKRPRQRNSRGGASAASSDVSSDDSG